MKMTLWVLEVIEMYLWQCVFKGIQCYSKSAKPSWPSCGASSRKVCPARKFVLGMSRVNQNVVFVRRGFLVNLFCQCLTEVLSPQHKNIFRKLIPPFSMSLPWRVWVWPNSLMSLLILTSDFFPQTDMLCGGPETPQFSKSVFVLVIVDVAATALSLTNNNSSAQEERNW